MPAVSFPVGCAAVPGGGQSGRDTFKAGLIRAAQWPLHTLSACHWGLEGHGCEGFREQVKMPKLVKQPQQWGRVDIIRIIEETPGPFANHSDSRRLGTGGHTNQAKGPRNDLAWRTRLPHGAASRLSLVTGECSGKLHASTARTGFHHNL